MLHQNHEKNNINYGVEIAMIKIIYSIYAMNDTGRFFSFEVNIWVFRLLWFALFGLILNGYLIEGRSV